MSTNHDLTDREFGKLTVLRRNGTSRDGRAMWECRCRCGNIVTVRGKSLRSGHTTSCSNSCGHTTHGHSGQYDQASPTYESWRAMLKRCGRVKDVSYRNYGNRGIRVCERWLIFKSFLDDMGERPPGTTLDRYPDKNGPYEPGNCRWATDAQQRRNRRDNIMLTHDGRTMCITDWAKQTGIGKATLAWRYRKGWDVVSILTTPVGG